jgi:kinesin family protein 5
LNVLQDKKSYMKEDLSKGSSEFGNRMGSYRSNPLRETLSGQRATIAKICEEGKILSVIGSNIV